MADDAPIPTFEELARAFYEAVRNNASHDEQLRRGYQMMELYPKEFETYEEFIHTMADVW